MSGLWFALSCLLLTCCSSASLKEPAASSTASCPPCAPAECAALPARGCPLGKVRDSCGCCWQCARGEGEACGMGAAAAAAAGPAVGWGRCAAGLECRRRRKGQAGVCVCKSRYPVCGTDGLTYPSACQLRAASLRSESRGERPVEQRNKGPCEQGPSIVTPPKDTWNVTGAQLFLSCEVIGVPTPVLTWNKITRGQYGVQRMELLPGDRDNLAIQTRGGPEKHEVTGWVLFPACIWDSNCKIGSTDIGCYVCRPCANVTSTYGYAESLETPSGKISPLSKDDAGEYECHALNSKGEATASARINVVNSLQEIPTIKGESTEL